MKKNYEKLFRIELCLLNCYKKFFSKKGNDIRQKFEILVMKKEFLSFLKYV